MPSDSYICERLLGSWLLGDKLLSSTYLIEKAVPGGWNHVTSHILGHFGDAFGPLWAILGPLLGPMERPRGVLDPLAVVSGGFGGSRGASGVSRGALGTLWGCLGTPWEALGEPSWLHWGARGGPEVFQGLLQGILGGFWAAICDSLAVYEMIEETLVCNVF